MSSLLFVCLRSLSVWPLQHFPIFFIFIQYSNEGTERIAPFKSFVLHKFALEMGLLLLSYSAIFLVSSTRVCFVPFNNIKCL